METDRSKSGTGYLRVRVSSAGGAFPEAGASVMIFTDDENASKVVKSLITDLSGQTEIVALETPAKALSEEPGNTKPYATYNVRVTKTGFYPVESVGVPVFDGITSLQRINLIPRSEFDEYSPAYPEEGTTVIETPPYTETRRSGGDDNG